MNLFSRVTALLGAAAVVGANAMPAAAVLATDYSPPKLIHRGSTSVPIAGSGLVVIKVLVKPDGSFQVMNVIRSTNHGDDNAALDMARHSTYRVGKRGGKPTTAFYDFTFRFTGKSVSAGDSAVSAGGGNAQASAISRMLRSGNYAGAKSAATSYLAKKPTDTLVQNYLGIANTFLNDPVAAADAFDKAATIMPNYKTIAGQAYSLAAVKVYATDPTQSLAYANKALAIKADGNAYFALGVAQLANNNAAGAVTSLKKAHDLAGSGVTTKEKVSIDTELLTAYMKNNDQAGAQSMIAEIKQLDPTNPAPAHLLAQTSFDQAQQFLTAGKKAEAIAQFEAGAQADPSAAVTGYAQAALIMGQMDKPDFKAMSAEADKALAAKADDPLANYAKGVALVNMGAANRDTAAKNQGITFLNKADAEAKAANMIGLATQIENFIKSIK